MRKTKVHVVEVVPDADLRKKEAKARAVLKRFFPNAGPARLYRTAEGRVGCQLDLTVTAGDRKRLHQAYKAIMDAVGEKIRRTRGRSPELSPSWALPKEAARVRTADTWLRGLLFAALGSFVLMLLLFVYFKFSLGSGVSELRAMVLPGR